MPRSVFSAVRRADGLCGPTRYPAAISGSEHAEQTNPNSAPTKTSGPAFSKITDSAQPVALNTVIGEYQPACAPVLDRHSERRVDHGGRCPIVDRVT